MPTQEEIGAINLLQSDFNQNFDQARHYDNQIFDSFKFLAMFYTTIGSITIGIHKYALDKKVDFDWALICGLIIALSFGILLFTLIVRNRVYFVISMRFINENRNNYLPFKPLTFQNKSKMYTDYTKPPFFDLLSTQLCLTYLVATLNSLILGVILYLAKQNFSTMTWASIGALVLQLIIAFIYLITRENKHPERAVFKRK